MARRTGTIRHSMSTSPHNDLTCECPVLGYSDNPTLIDSVIKGKFGFSCHEVSMENDGCGFYWYVKNKTKDILIDSGSCTVKKDIPDPTACSGEFSYTVTENIEKDDIIEVSIERRHGESGGYPLTLRIGINTTYED